MQPSTKTVAIAGVEYQMRVRNGIVVENRIWKAIFEARRFEGSPRGEEAGSLGRGIVDQANNNRSIQYQGAVGAESTR